MKRLVLIRHGKSDWSHDALSDFDRPLNKRGIRDCPEMAERLLRRKIYPDRWISSTAKRARETVEKMNTVLAFDRKKIFWTDQLYLASPSEIIEVLKKEGGEASTLFVTGHNPGITEVAGILSDIRIDNIPTCGIFGMQVELKNWSEAGRMNFTFEFFDYPKNRV